jgi:uncharacterized LabA/DUF88 family protein
VVRFFGKQPRKTSKEAATSDAAPPARTPAPRSSTAAAAKPAAAPADDTEKKPATRTRRAPVRPPRRDWAAEAAATPVEAPAPKPASLATSPAEDADGGTGAAPAKRRRGTRGGRGRKKPGAAATTTTTAITAPEAPRALQLVRELPKKPGQPVSLEAVVEHQAAVLESFAHDVTATLHELQASIAGLKSQARVEGAGVQQRVGIFVDVPNVIYAAERRNVNIDFGRVLDYFTRGRQLVRASAYAPISDDPSAKLESQRFVHHFVGHPYRIITKPLKRFADGSMKANFDIELAIDILTMSDRLDVVVLMSGDGDFRRLVEMISSRGVRVEVVAFSETASSELKSAADLYVDIGAHLDDFKAAR